MVTGIKPSDFTYQELLEAIAAKAYFYSVIKDWPDDKDFDDQAEEAFRERLEDAKWEDEG